MTKLSMAVAAVSFAASFVCAFAQAERIREKIRGDKRRLEPGGPDRKPPPPEGEPK